MVITTEMTTMMNMIITDLYRIQEVALDPEHQIGLDRAPALDRIIVIGRNLVGHTPVVVVGQDLARITLDPDPTVHQSHVHVTGHIDDHVLDLDRNPSQKLPNLCQPADPGLSRHHQVGHDHVQNHEVVPGHELINVIKMKTASTRTSPNAK